MTRQCCGCLPAIYRQSQKLPAIGVSRPFLKSVCQTKALDFFEPFAGARRAVGRHGLPHQTPTAQVFDGINDAVRFARVIAFISRRFGIMETCVRELVSNSTRTLRPTAGMISSTDEGFNRLLMPLPRIFFHTTAPWRSRIQTSKRKKTTVLPRPSNETKESPMPPYKRQRKDRQRDKHKSQGG